MAPWPTSRLLVLGNIVMIYARHEHLKQPHWPLRWAIGVSSGTAFVEYRLAMQALGVGYGISSWTASESPFLWTESSPDLRRGIAAAYPRASRESARHR